MLEVTDLTKSFGAVRALDGCSLALEPGRITGLIGPNGSGKTTLFNVVSGHYAVDSGVARLDGTDITGLGPHTIARLGLSRTFQVTRVFREMSVLENLVAAVHGRSLHDAVEQAMDLLELVGLIDYRNTMASQLSYGQSKLVEFARAHMNLDAKIVLLDEPFAGINRTLANRIIGHITMLREEREATYLIVDHEMPLLMGLCEHMIVMDAGRVLTEGDPQAVRSDPAVLDAYFGKA